MAAEGEVVEALEKQPVLFPDLAYHWQVFLDLNEIRCSGFNGVEPITYSEIAAYMAAHRIEKDNERKRLMDRIRFLDREYFAFLAEEQKRKEAK